MQPYTPNRNPNPVCALRAHAKQPYTPNRNPNPVCALRAHAMQPYTLRNPNPMQPYPHNPIYIFFSNARLAYHNPIYLFFSNPRYRNPNLLYTILLFPSSFSCPKNLP